MVKAFGTATGQEVILYHSLDTQALDKKGHKHQELAGEAAEAAWRVPVKEAKDLPGRVSYLTGMAVFCTDNTATELGLSKGSMGTIVSIRYIDRGGRRYAISAEVDFPGFKGDNKDFPHRVLL
ncbi:hypothetical protein C8R45DRAFT_795498, partial [Mycena sanguinolenta]